MISAPSSLFRSFLLWFLGRISPILAYVDHHFFTIVEHIAYYPEHLLDTFRFPAILHFSPLTNLLLFPINVFADTLLILALYTIFLYPLASPHSRSSLRVAIPFLFSTYPRTGPGVILIALGIDYGLCKPLSTGTAPRWLRDLCATSVLKPVLDTPGTVRLANKNLRKAIEERRCAPRPAERSPEEVERLKQGAAAELEEARVRWYLRQGRAGPEARQERMGLEVMNGWRRREEESVDDVREREEKEERFREALHKINLTALNVTRPEQIQPAVDRVRDEFRRTAYWKDKELFQGLKIHRRHFREALAIKCELRRWPPEFEIGRSRLLDAEKMWKEDKSWMEEEERYVQDDRETVRTITVAVDDRFVCTFHIDDMMQHLDSFTQEAITYLFEHLIFDPLLVKIWFSLHSQWSALEATLEHLYKRAPSRRGFQSLDGIDRIPTYKPFPPPSDEASTTDRPEGFKTRKLRVCTWGYHAIGADRRGIPCPCNSSNLDITFIVDYILRSFGCGRIMELDSVPVPTREKIPWHRDQGHLFDFQTFAGWMLAGTHWLTLLSSFCREGPPPKPGRKQYPLKAEYEAACQKWEAATMLSPGNPLDDLLKPTEFVKKAYALEYVYHEPLMLSLILRYLITTPSEYALSSRLTLYAYRVPIDISVPITHLFRPITPPPVINSPVHGRLLTVIENKSDRSPLYQAHVKPILPYVLLLTQVDSVGPTLSGEIQNALQASTWSGNVTGPSARELITAIFRAQLVPLLNLPTGTPLLWWLNLIFLFFLPKYTAQTPLGEEPLELLDPADTTARKPKWKKFHAAESKSESFQVEWQLALSHTTPARHNFDRFRSQFNKALSTRIATRHDARALTLSVFADIAIRFLALEVARYEWLDDHRVLGLRLDEMLEGERRRNGKPWWEVPGILQAVRKSQMMAAWDVQHPTAWRHWDFALGTRYRQPFWLKRLLGRLGLRMVQGKLLINERERGDDELVMEEIGFSRIEEVLQKLVEEVVVFQGYGVMQACLSQVLVERRRKRFLGVFLGLLGAAVFAAVGGAVWMVKDELHGASTVKIWKTVWGLPVKLVSVYVDRVLLSEDATIWTYLTSVLLSALLTSHIATDTQHLSTTVVSVLRRLAGSLASPEEPRDPFAPAPPPSPKPRDPAEVKQTIKSALEYTPPPWLQPFLALPPDAPLSSRLTTLVHHLLDHNPVYTSKHLQIFPATFTNPTARLIADRVSHWVVPTIPHPRPNGEEAQQDYEVVTDEKAQELIREHRTKCAHVRAAVLRDYLEALEEAKKQKAAKAKEERLRRNGLELVKLYVRTRGLPGHGVKGQVQGAAAETAPETQEKSMEKTEMIKKEAEEKSMEKTEMIKKEAEEEARKWVENAHKEKALQMGTLHNLRKINKDEKERELMKREEEIKAAKKEREEEQKKREAEKGSLWSQVGEQVGERMKEAKAPQGKTAQEQPTRPSDSQPTRPSDNQPTKLSDEQPTFPLSGGITNPPMRAADGSWESAPRTGRPAQVLDSPKMPAATEGKHLQVMDSPSLARPSGKMVDVEEDEGNVQLPPLKLPAATEGKHLQVRDSPSLAPPSKRVDVEEDDSSVQLPPPQLSETADPVEASASSANLEEDIPPGPTSPDTSADDFSLDDPHASINPETFEDPDISDPNTSTETNSAGANTTNLQDDLSAFAAGLGDYSGGTDEDASHTDDENNPTSSPEAGAPAPSDNPPFFPPEDEHRAFEPKPRIRRDSNDPHPPPAPAPPSPPPKTPSPEHPEKVQAFTTRDKIARSPAPSAHSAEDDEDQTARLPDFRPGIQRTLSDDQLGRNRSESAHSGSSREYESASERSEGGGKLYRERRNVRLGDELAGLGFASGEEGEEEEEDGGGPSEDGGSVVMAGSEQEGIEQGGSETGTGTGETVPGGDGEGEEVRTPLVRANEAGEVETFMLNEETTAVAQQPPDQPASPTNDGFELVNPDSNQAGQDLADSGELVQHSEAPPDTTGLPPLPAGSVIEEGARHGPEPHFVPRAPVAPWAPAVQDTATADAPVPSAAAETTPAIEVPAEAAAAGENTPVVPDSKGGDAAGSAEGEKAREEEEGKEAMVQGSSAEGGVGEE